MMSRQAVQETIQRVPVSGTSSGQRLRRLYRAANTAWYLAHRALPVPLVMPPQRRVPPPLPERTRIFEDGEIRRLFAVADTLSLQHSCLVRLLFTTGVRIGSVAAIQWSQVLTPTQDAVAVTAPVREKGGQVHTLLLVDGALRDCLWRLWCQQGSTSLPFGRAPKHTKPLCTRQLRNWSGDALATKRFHRLRGTPFASAPDCPEAIVTHIPPATQWRTDCTGVAAESVSLAMFHAGNTLPIIAKFLGHHPSAWRRATLPSPSRPHNLALLPAIVLCGRFIPPADATLPCVTKQRNMAEGLRAAAQQQVVKTAATATWYGLWAAVTVKGLDLTLGGDGVLARWTWTPVCMLIRILIRLWIVLLLGLTAQRFAPVAVDATTGFVLYVTLVIALDSSLHAEVRWLLGLSDGQRILSESTTVVGPDLPYAWMIEA